MLSQSIAPWGTGESWLQPAAQRTDHLDVAQLAARTTRLLRAALLGAALAALTGACAPLAPPLLPEAALGPYAVGIGHLAAGRPQAATEHLVLATILAPDSAEVHDALARAYTQKGRLALARWHLARAVSLEPEMAERRLALARLQLEAARFRAAVREAEAVLDSGDFERPWEAWLVLARAHSLAGDLAAARKSVGVALELRPGLPQGWLELGIVARQQGAIAEALGAFSRALASAPHPSLASEARVRRAEVLEQLGLLDVALDELRQAADRAPLSAWGLKARDALEQLATELLQASREPLHPWAG